jgi:hypothetical protein
MSSIQFEGGPLTLGYRPAPIRRAMWNGMGMPPLTFAVIDMMRVDYQVALGLAIKQAPLQRIKFAVTGNRKDICHFVGNQIKKIWSISAQDIFDSMIYGSMFGETVYERNKLTGMLEFVKIRPLHPQDCRILQIHGAKVGIRVVHGMRYGKSNSQRVDMMFPRGFHHPNKARFGSIAGVSDLEGAYPPWYEKCVRDGARDMRLQWFYRNAYNGGVLYYPEGNTKYPDGTTVSNHDVARQILERVKTGSAVALPRIEGTAGWEYSPPSANGGPVGEMEGYIASLDRSITRGMGIPDDILSADGIGGYAGRNVPLQAFFTSLEKQASAAVVSVVDQIVRPLCRANYGSGTFSVQDVRLAVYSEEEQQQQQDQGGEEGGEGQPEEPQEQMSREASGKNVLRFDTAEAWHNDEPFLWSETQFSRLGKNRGVWVRKVGPRHGVYWQRGEEKRYQEDKPSDGIETSVIPPSASGGSIPKPPESRGKKASATPEDPLLPMANKSGGLAQSYLESVDKVRKTVSSPIPAKPSTLAASIYKKKTPNRLAAMQSFRPASRVEIDWSAATEKWLVNEVQWQPTERGSPADAELKTKSGAVICSVEIKTSLKGTRSKVNFGKAGGAPSGKLQYAKDSQIIPMIFVKEERSRYKDPDGLASLEAMNLKYPMTKNAVGYFRFGFQTPEFNAMWPIHQHNLDLFKYLMHSTPDEVSAAIAKFAFDLPPNLNQTLPSKDHMRELKPFLAKAAQKLYAYRQSPEGRRNKYSGGIMAYIKATRGGR